MNTNEIPKAHPELLDALHRQDEQARKMKFSEDFTEKVMNKVKSEKSRFARKGKYRIFRKIAAIFLAAVFLCGLAWAIFPHVFFPKTNMSQPAQVTTPSLTERAVDGSPVRFDDVRLDSILTIISAHYGKSVHFCDKELRGMKLITTWNPADSLSAFIEHINMFDYLHLTLQEDTIFVESVNEEDE